MSNVDKKFEDWKKRFEFPDFYDFNIRALLQLQEDFESCPPDHVKTKRELLDMIVKIQNSLPREFFSWL
jgi:hypothetical protein